MCKHWMALVVVVAANLAGAQSSTARPQTRTQAVPPTADSLTTLRLSYLAQIDKLVPQWRAAERQDAIDDSIRLTALPRDTVRVGATTWLVDLSEAPNVPDALTRSWETLLPPFGSELDRLAGRVFAARVRANGSDTSRRVLELGEVHPGNMDIFERVQARLSTDVLEQLITKHVAKLVAQNGDPALLAWLGEPYVPAPLRKSARQDMYVDLVTAPSQVASRCLSGDLRRCRDAIGLVPTPDPLSEWYDAPERRMLVLRMKDMLANGPQRAQFDECALRFVYVVCDRLLRTTPRYTPPAPLPTSARLHLFRTALEMGGNGAYSRMVAAGPRTVEDRLAAGAGVPIDTLVARWRSDITSAHPLPPAPSLLTTWTAVAWGVAAMVIALRFVAWR